MKSEAESLSEGPPSGDFDVPPAIACAHCGLTSCEGCAPDSSEPAHPQNSPGLPWETEDAGLFVRLVATSELTATEPGRVFGQLAPGSASAALRFALLCESLAVASFSLIWAVGFCAVFPGLAFHMITSLEVLALASAILASLVVFVVFVHAQWGFALEWGIQRAGGKPSWNLGLRFGLYACGWDLLTSPAGLALQIPRSGWKAGLATVRAGTKAPRLSVNAYLEDCRQLNFEERKTAVWTAIWLGLVCLAVSGLVLFALLLLWWLPVRF